jgi:hypothetical protein
VPRARAKPSRPSNPASKSSTLVASALHPIVHRIIAAVLAPPGDEGHARVAGDARQAGVEDMPAKRAT